MLSSRRQSAGARGNAFDSGTVLAFDFGEKRVGVAVGEFELGIAHPLTTIRAEDNRGRFSAIESLVAEWRPVVLVVGVPFHPEDGNHEIARLARRFAQRLEGRFGITTRLVDERLTSRAAESALREQGVPVRGLKGSRDEAAAQHILQAYFNDIRTKHPARTARDLW